MNYSAKEVFLYLYTFDGLDSYCSEKMRQAFTINGKKAHVPMFLDNDGNIVRLDILDTAIPQAKMLIASGTNEILVFPGNKKYPPKINISPYSPDQNIIPGATDAVDVFRKFEQERTPQGQSYVSSQELSAGGVYFLIGTVPDVHYDIVEGKNVETLTAVLTVQGNFYRDFQKPASGDSSSEKASLIDNSGQKLEDTNPPASTKIPTSPQTPGLTMDEGRLVRFATYDGATNQMIDSSNSSSRGQVIQAETREDGYLYDAQTGALLVTDTFLYYKYDPSRQTVAYVKVEEKGGAGFLWLLFGGLSLWGLASLRKKR